LLGAFLAATSDSDFDHDGVQERKDIRGASQEQLGKTKAVCQNDGQVEFLRNVGDYSDVHRARQQSAFLRFRDTSDLMEVLHGDQVQEIL